MKSSRFGRVDVAPRFGNCGLSEVGHDDVVADPPAGARHPNVASHFTPTSASGLDHVEIRFGIFQRKTLDNASFRSIEQRINALSCAHNDDARAGAC